MSRCHIAFYTHSCRKHSHSMLIYPFFIIFSLPGPTPIHSIGIPRFSSIKLTYFLQFSGSPPYDDAVPIDVFQPGRVTYDTSAVFSVSRFAAAEPD